MACQTIKNNPLVCDTNLMGGTLKVYVIASKDLGTASGTTEPFAVSQTTGVITQIATSGSTKFVAVGQLKNVAALGSELTNNVTQGTSFWTTSGNLQLQGLTSANYQFMESLRGQPISVIYQSRSGQYYAAFNLNLTAATTSTGTAEGDLIGMTLTLSGTNPYTELPVETAAVASAITP